MPDQQYHTIDPCILFEAAGHDLAAFHDLSKTFLRIAAPMFARLERAILAGNCKAIIYESHALRGTTSLVGAMQLTQMLKEIESLALQCCQDQNQDQNGVVQQIPELTRVFDAVMQEVQASIVYFQGNAGSNRHTAPT